jgi:hypothetical protein
MQRGEGERASGVLFLWRNLAQRVFAAYRTVLPCPASGFAFLMTPGIVSDMNALLVLLDSVVADVADIASKLLEERFLKVLDLSWHASCSL